MLDRERVDAIVRLTANDVEVPCSEAALVTRQVMTPDGTTGRTSWEVVVRDATVALTGQLDLMIDLGKRRVRGTAHVTSDDRQAEESFALRTTVLAGSGELEDVPTP